MAERKTGYVAVHIDDELTKVMKKYCKENGYKLNQFVEIALRNEMESRLHGYRRKISW